MTIKIEMDMPTDFSNCRFYSFTNPANQERFCNADLRYHTYKAYDCRCDDCPLKEVKQWR